jgi:uncharacterized membrane protein
MKIHLPSLLACALLLLLIPSCTLEKRRYMGGYHFERISKPKDMVRLDKTESLDSLNVASVQSSSSKIVLDSIAIQGQDHTVRTTASECIPEKTATAAETRTTTDRAKKVPVPVFEQKRWDAQVQQPNDEKETQSTSILAIITIALAIIAMLLLVLAMFAIDGWAALGYVILATLVAIVSLVIGILTLVIDKPKNLKIPIAFYVFFIVMMLISLWVVGGILLARLGLI